MRTTSCLLALLLATTIEAQVVTVTDEQITTHGESFPRFASLTESRLVVPAGEQFEFPETTTVSAIEIAGYARVSREHATLIVCDNLTILPGGTLDIGTVADLCPQLVEIQFRGEPLLESDTDQMGRGLQNLGTLLIHGLPRSPFAEIAEVNAGDRTLTLLGAPTGWLPGDELVIPDTHQITAADPLRHEVTVRIESINGNSVTLQAPLEHDHPGAVSPEGELRFLPYAVNVTREIVFRSQDTDHKAHIVNLPGSMVDCRNFAVLDLGRTRADLPLDPLINRVGRYGFHLHHVNQHTDQPPGSVIGAYVRGADRWGLVVHQTHEYQIEGNIADLCMGAGITTEDGNEEGNVISGNLAMRCFGNGIKNLNAADRATFQGGDGSGFWFHGSSNKMFDNIACNNRIGINFFTLFNPPLKDRAGKVYAVAKPVGMETSGNVAFSNSHSGIETWGPKAHYGWVLEDSAAWHNGGAQLRMGSGNVQHARFDGLELIGKGRTEAGLHCNLGYHATVLLSRATISGCSFGMGSVGRRSELTDVRFADNFVDIDWSIMRLPGPSILWHNVRAESGAKFVVGTKRIEGSGPAPQRVVTAWQGTEDLQIVMPGEQVEGAVPHPDFVGMTVVRKNPPPPPDPPPPPSPDERIAQLEQRIAQLEAQIAQLLALIQQLLGR